MTGFTPEEWRTAARVARRSIFTEGNPDLADAWEKAADQAEAHLISSSLTTQLAKLMFEGNAGLGWSGVSESVREIYIRAADTVLAHLQSAGRLIPAGGMALTAEQVEDVRLIASENYPLDSDPTASFNRLRALFPATEPAEEETKAEAGGDFIEIVFDGPPEAVSGRFVEVENPQGASISVGEWIDRGDGFWALRIRSDEPHLMSQLSVPEIRNAAFREAADVLDQALKANPVTTLVTGRGRILDLVTSSPVAPAPTETGPWQRIEDVPKSVYLIKDCEGDKWRRDRKSWEVYSERGFRWHPGFPDRFAPFVAAEEG